MEKLHYLEFKYQELRLLRAVVTEIEAVDKQFPGVVPHGIMKRYNEIKRFYERQLADEEYLETTFHPNVSLPE